MLYVALMAIRGAEPAALRARRGARARRPVLQLLVVGFGLALLFQPEVLTDPASIAGSPSLEDMVFAFPLVLVAFSGIDASSGLAGQVAIGRAGLRRLIGVRLVAAMVPYLGHRAGRLLGAAADRRALGRGAADRRRRRVRAGLAARAAAKYLVAISARRDPGQRRPGGDARALAARLRAGRQPPDPVARSARCSRTRATPVGIIAFGAVTAICLLIPADLEFLAAICAFGATIAFTIVGALGRAGCATRSPTATARTGCRSTCASAAARCRSPACCAS